MDNRKRLRMEMPTTTLAGSIGVDAALGGQSIFLNSTGNVGDGCGLPANVFLTICDENSDEESQEYLSIEDSNTLAAHIKQEQDVGTQTTQTLPLQYRFVNQLQRQLPSPTETTLLGAAQSSATTSTAVLPPAMQLPSGCEIYLVKEYVEPLVSSPTMLAAPTNVASTTIKVEPDASDMQLARGNVMTTKGANAKADETATGAGKRSYILEAYKKRDDKRRATHNEVERRRRDKINSWIFKLKEMLPADMPNSNGISIINTNSTAANACSNNNCAATTNEQQRGINNNNNNNNNSRTPPSDSKSQILIKACEYIKAMQDEIKSLRECLTENENLRLSNQRLQNELNRLKSEQSNGNSVSSNNNNSNLVTSRTNSNFNMTLNSLNSNGLFSNNSASTGSGGSAASSATIVGTASLGNINANGSPFTKRELIIRDYVD